jgi:hypothetical protein
MKRRSFLGMLLAAPVVAPAAAHAFVAAARSSSVKSLTGEAGPEAIMPVRSVSGVRRIVMGKNADGEIGYWVSSPGVDALTGAKVEPK